MKKLIMVLVLMPLVALADRELVDGVEWNYYVRDGQAEVCRDDDWSEGIYRPAIPEETIGSITIPSLLGGCPVTSVGLRAFSGCGGLTSVTIPSCVTNISDAEFAFEHCNSLKVIIVADGNVAYSSLDGILYDKPQTKMIFCPMGNCGPVVIPEGVSSIGATFFSQCSGLTSVTIPSTVTNIGLFAFSGCSGLRTLTIPKSVVSVGDWAFLGCSSLMSMTISDRFSVSALCDNHGLTNVTIQVVDGKILGGAFRGLSRLKSVVIPEGITSIGDLAFADCSGLESVIIPSSVTKIGTSAFSCCDSATSVTIPASVASIGREAFAGCGKITTATIPARFRIAEVFPDSFGVLTDATVLSSDGKICDRMFEDCRCLTSVAISGDVDEIGESAFENCRHLESITIPETVKKIDDYAFYGCGRLKTVNYLGEMPEIGGAAFVGTGVEQPPSADVVNVVVSNVIVQYVFNSVQPEFAIPTTSDTGFVNIITEVNGGSVAVPATWASEYPNFVSKYGSDFTKALAMKTGKKDGAGNEMLVWQDYVAGTDPTDEKDVFTASITIVDGKVTISYTPELDDARKAMRKYTTWGKTSLMDTDWTEVQEGRETEYNFFKVSVEMR